MGQRHPMTPAHIRGAYEQGRWARQNGFHPRDCPHAHFPCLFQEWGSGWCDEDEVQIALAIKDGADAIEWAEFYFTSDVK